MTHRQSRREFVQKTAIAAGLLTSSAAAAEESPRETPNTDSQATPPPREIPFEQYSRQRPTYGGPPGSDHYLGKLVPGFRQSHLGPVPVQGPDLEKLPFKLVDGVKEFHLVCEPVRRELLPNYSMNFYGYNGGMPGPIIEATQGDRVRFVVDNKLPEPTTIHWHGLELPISEDGVPGITQKPIPPGGRYVYEFDLHQTGTFFYHSHFPMQEAFGMVGYFIIHPAVAFDPPVDRDFLLLFQNFQIPETQTIPDSMSMDWNWHTINGRSGPYTTPMVCKLGERVRIRIMNFSPMQHHPVHLHGHTFWVTGHEGTRIPSASWIPRNTELIGVAQSADLEFIAFNPGDWLLHCHMVHHMMNHMVKQVGPRIRSGVSAADNMAPMGDHPAIEADHETPAFRVPGYPQNMQGMEMSEATMKAIWSRREVQGMNPMYSKSVHGLMTVVRVLPDDLYHRVMETNEEIPKGMVFDEIVRRSKRHPHQRS